MLQLQFQLSSISMIEEDIQRNSTTIDPRRSKKVKKLLHNLKNIMMTNNNFEDLYQNLSDLCQSSPQPDQLRTLDKMIRTVCLRLRSALQMVDHFVFAIKCLESSIQCAEDIFSQEDFEKCLGSIQKLMKRNEVNDWVGNIKKFIDSKKARSAIFCAKDKRQERKFLESTSEQTKFKKKEQALVVNPKQPSSNQNSKAFSFEATKEQIKQKFTQTQLPKRQSNQPTDKRKDIKQDVYSEKQKKLKSLDAAEVILNEKTQRMGQKNVLKFEIKDTSSIIQEYQKRQNYEQMRQSVDEQMRQSVDEQKLSEFQNCQIQDRAEQIVDVDENDSKLMKSMFAIKNAKNLNFLKKVLWEECKFKIRNTEQLYSSYKMQDFDLTENEFKDKNILLLAQFVNGIVVGGFKRQEKYIENLEHRGFLFSLSKQETFPILPGNKQLQLLKLNGEEIIFGKDELKINHVESTVSSNFGSGKGVFDCKLKDVDYLIGENTRKTVGIHEYAIYQII